MSHLTKQQIALCKEKLDTVLIEQTGLLEQVDTEIMDLRTKEIPIPEKLAKQKNKIEGILSATKKSLEQIKDGIYGYDIADGKPIPYSLLKEVPYIKVNRSPITPVVTCKSGSANRAYGNY